MKEVDSLMEAKEGNLNTSASFCTPVHKPSCVMQSLKPEQLSSVQMHKEKEIKNNQRVIDCAVIDKRANFYQSTAFCTSYNKSVSSVPNVKPEKLSSAQHSEYLIQSNKGTIFPLTLSPNSTHDAAEIGSTIYESINVSIGHRTVKLKSSNETNSRTSQTVVCTPRPISIYSKSKEMDSCSPEFLMKGTPGTLLKSAPICTPLVLRREAENAKFSPETSLSPVRLKLDFSEKEAPKAESK